jgi:hypothetical protein
VAAVDQSAERSDDAAGFESSWKRARDIDGWLTREQALALYHAARTVPMDTAVVEIGSHHGKSTGSCWRRLARIANR